MRKNLLSWLTIAILSLIIASSSVSASSLFFTSYTIVSNPSLLLYSSPNLISVPTPNPLTNSISNNNIPTLIVYYNIQGYFAYVLSNQTEPNYFIDNPQVYQNIYPNLTFYSTLPSINVNQSNSTQANSILPFAYTGSIFYTPATQDIVQLECYFVNYDVCNSNTTTGSLSLANFINYIQGEPNYNTTIIFNDTNPSLLKQIEGFGTQIINGIISIYTFIPLTIANSLIGNGNTLIPPQRASPLYNSISISSNQALPYIISNYPSNPQLQVYFNYENVLYSNTNMETSINQFNNNIDGNQFQQAYNQFFGTYLVLLFVISIVCFMMLKFNGGN